MTSAMEPVPLRQKPGAAVALCQTQIGHGTAGVFAVDIQATNPAAAELTAYCRQ